MNIRDLLREWEGVTASLYVGADAFDLTHPHLWERSPSGEWARIPDRRSDVYDALEEYAESVSDHGTEVSAFVLVTVGWAAPMNPDGSVPDAPASRHADRKRVRLSVGLTPDGGTASLLQFADADEETVLDTAGTGSLADALDSVGLALWGSGFAVSVLASYVDTADSLPDGDAETLAGRVARFLGTGVYDLPARPFGSLTEVLDFVRERGQA